MRKNHTFIIIFIIICLVNVSLYTQATHQLNSDDTTSLTTDMIKTSPKKLQVLSKEKYDFFTVSEISKTISTNPRFSTSVLPENIYPIQRYPTLATSGNNILLLAETNTNTSNPGRITATSSQNNGTTWDYHMTLSHEETSFTTPSLDYTGDPEMQGFGASLIDEKTGVQMIYCFPSLIDPLAVYEGGIPEFNRNGWFSGRMITWDTSYWTEVVGTATAGFPHGTTISPYQDFHGLTIWGGHDGTGWSYYFYCDTDQYTENHFKILWKNYLDGPIQNVDIDIDLTTGWEYDLCEIINQSTMKNEIYMDMLFLEPGNREWFNNDQNYGPNWIFREYSHPSLKATNGCVYLACIREGDIFLHLSKNKGYTYDTIQITDTSDIERFPEITVINNHIIISYQKDNNLYTIISQDNGDTWSAPNQINQENGMVSPINNHICIDNEYICWTENKDNESLSLIKQDIKTPQFIIHDVTGGFNLSFQITNIGSADANNIPYQIQINDGWVLSERTINQTIDCAIGETKTITLSQPVLGLGSPLITMKIGQATVTMPSKLWFFYLIINNE